MTNVDTEMNSHAILEDIDMESDVKAPNDDNVGMQEIS